MANVVSLAYVCKEDAAEWTNKLNGSHDRGVVINKRKYNGRKRFTNYIIIVVHIYVKYNLLARRRINKNNKRFKYITL